MDSDKSITANFIKVQYNVEIIQTENGQIQVKTIKEGITNQTDYNSGTILELTAVPNEGFEFIEWGSNDENISGLNTNPLQITITKPIRIWAEWRIKQYVVKGNINGIGGFNLWANDDANQTFSFEITQVVHNTNLKLEARNLQGIVGQHRSECWKFNEWSGDKTGNENPSYIIINRSDIEVTANFKINEPSERKVSKQGEGDVNIELLFGSNDGDNYRCGSEFRITATPSSGWYFSKWEVTRENNNQTDYFDRTENPLTQTVYFNSAEKMNFKAIFLQN